MGKGGIVFYFWEADATEKGSLGPNTVVNSNQNQIGNLAHTQHLTDRGGVIEVFHRIILDDLKGYTVTGVTHGHDSHLQPREWMLGLSGMSLRYLL